MDFLKKTNLEFSWFACITTLTIISTAVQRTYTDTCGEENSYDTVLKIILFVHYVQLIFITISCFSKVKVGGGSLCVASVGLFPALILLYCIIHFLIVNGC